MNYCVNIHANDCLIVNYLKHEWNISTCYRHFRLCLSKVRSLWSHWSRHDFFGINIQIEPWSFGIHLPEYFALWLTNFFLSLEIGLPQNIQSKFKIHWNHNCTLYCYYFEFQHTTKLEKFIPEFEANKLEIQNAFWREKRIRVDQVRRDGGNSSDGNVSFLLENLTLL